MIKKFHSWVSHRSFGLFVLRLVAGFVFISHGTDTLLNIPEATQFFAQIHLAPFFVYLVGWSQVVFGALLVLGLFTRIAAIPLLIIALMAIILVKGPFTLSAIAGFNPAVLTPWFKIRAVFAQSEGEISLIAMCLALITMGSGCWSLARFCRCKCHKNGGERCGVCHVIGCDDCGGCDTCSVSHTHHSHEGHTHA